MCFFAVCGGLLALGLVFWLVIVFYVHGFHGFFGFYVASILYWLWLGGVASVAFGFLCAFDDGG